MDGGAEERSGSPQPPGQIPTYLPKVGTLLQLMPSRLLYLSLTLSLGSHFLSPSSVLLTQQLPAFSCLLAPC